MTRLRPRSARTVVAGLVAAAALTLTGCSATNPIQTQANYSASDGLSATVGGVRALNMLVVAAGENEPGVLSGALSNGGAQDEDVTLEVAGAEPVEVTVPGGGAVLVGVSDAPARYMTVDVEVPAVDTAPGGLTTLRITSASSGSVELRVPVMDGALPEYAAVLEAIPAPEATPTTEATPETTQDASEPEQERTDEDS